MIDLGTLGSGDSSVALDVNNIGTVVGESDVGGALMHAFRWTQDGLMSDMGSLDGPSGTSQAAAINELGEVVGFSSVAGAIHAFRWDSAQGMIDLGTLAGGDMSAANDVNDAGVVTGFSSVAGGARHAVIWGSSGSIVDLGVLPGGLNSYGLSINSDGTVAGFGDVSGGAVHAFLWSQQGGLQDLGALPGGTIGLAMGINNSAEVIGYGSIDSLNQWRAFAWSSQLGMTDVGDPYGSGSAFGHRINNAGFAVGFAEVGAGLVHAVLWDVRTIVDPNAPADPLHAPDSMAAWLFADSTTAFLADSANTFLKHIVIVAFNAVTPANQRQAVFDSLSGTVVGGFWQPGIDGAYYVKVPNGGMLDSLFAAAGRARLLAGVMASFVILKSTPLHLRPNDGVAYGFAKSDWRITQDSVDGTNWALEDIAAPLAWGCTSGERSAPVAIVEQYGTSAQHDITPNVSPHYRPGLRSIGNPYLSGDYELGSHGVRVMSVVAAEGDNNLDITGVMQRAHIRVYNAEDATTMPGPNLTAAAVIQAGRDGALVINYSIGWTWRRQGTPFYTPSFGNSTDSNLVVSRRDELMYALTTLRNENSYPLMVVSAGNDRLPAEWTGEGWLRQDSAFANQILVVGGTAQPPPNAPRTARGLHVVSAYQGSNFGPLVDIVAPGAAITTISQTGSVEPRSGTSYAAPHVTGTLGLVLSLDPALAQLPGQQFAIEMRRLLFAGADSSNRSASGQGGPYRVLDAYETLKEVARRSGGPICGNRVWAAGDSIHVDRGPNGVESIGASGAAPTHLLDVPHGGHEVRWFNDSWDARRLRFTVAGWAGPTTTSVDAPNPGGTMHSLLLRSHDGDTVVVLDQSIDSLENVAPDSQRVYVIMNDSAFTIADTGFMDLASARQGAQPCIPDVVYYDPCAAVSGLWAVSAAYPQRSDTLLLALNFYSVTRTSGTIACLNDLMQPDFCPWWEYAWEPDSVAVYAYALASKQFQYRTTMHDQWIYWVGASERGDEYVLAIGSEELIQNSITLTSRTIHDCRVQYRDRSLSTVRRQILDVNACPDHSELNNQYGARGGATIAPRRSRIRDSRP